MAKSHEFKKLRRLVKDQLLTHPCNAFTEQRVLNYIQGNAPYVTDWCKNVDPNQSSLDVIRSVMKHLSKKCFFVKAKLTDGTRLYVKTDTVPH